jgi:mannose-1-phosphate guanylyltransferase
MNRITSDRANFQFNTLDKIALILVGGSGKKLWPYSDKYHSEQFINVFNDVTLFQHIYQLINMEIDADKIWVIANENVKTSILEQVPTINENNIIIEPNARGTATAVCMAMLLLQKHLSPETLVCIFPSDQRIANIEEFHIAMDAACKTAYTLDSFVTIGIEPNRPDSQYGYIQYCDPRTDELNSEISDDLYKQGVRKVINFAEKPDISTAKRFYESGEFFWNSGILVAKQSNLVAEFRSSIPYLYERIFGLQHLLDTENLHEELSKVYKTVNSISLDYGILEHVENVCMVKATFDWTDINNWNDCYQMTQKDAMENVLLGNVFSVDTTNSLVISNEKFVATIGMDDVIIINTDKALLVCKRTDADKVEKLVNQIIDKRIPLY